MPDLGPSAIGSRSKLLDGIGLWAELCTEDCFADKPALFLDRDGVVVEETGYLGRPEDVVMIPEIADAIAAVNAAGLPVILVTNQSGIARGYFDWDGFAAVQAVVSAELARSLARFDLILACGYHRDGAPPLNAADHPWRKPRPGMVEYGASLFAVERRRSLIVGDRLSDLQAGQAAGLGGGTLVLSGHGRGDARITREWIAGPERAHHFAATTHAFGSRAIDRWLHRVTNS